MPSVHPQYWDTGEIINSVPFKSQADWTILKTDECFNHYRRSTRPHSELVKSPKSALKPASAMQILSGHFRYKTTFRFKLLNCCYWVALLAPVWSIRYSLHPSWYPNHHHASITWNTKYPRRPRYISSHSLRSLKLDSRITISQVIMTSQLMSTTIPIPPSHLSPTPHLSTKAFS